MSLAKEAGKIKWPWHRETRFEKVKRALKGSWKKFKRTPVAKTLGDIVSGVGARAAEATVSPETAKAVQRRAQELWEKHAPTEETKKKALAVAGSAGSGVMEYFRRKAGRSG